MRAIERERERERKTKREERKTLWSKRCLHSPDFYRYCRRSLLLNPSSAIYPFEHWFVVATTKKYTNSQEDEKWFTSQVTSEVSQRGKSGNERQTKFPRMLPWPALTILPDCFLTDPMPATELLPESGGDEDRRSDTKRARTVTRWSSWTPIGKPSSFSKWAKRILRIYD